jgi:hypothetical protein
MRLGGRSAHDASVSPMKTTGAISVLAPSPAARCDAAAPV